MTIFYSGVAGRRGRNPDGLVYHDDAGSQGATAAFYRGWLPTHQAENGFAHYYTASDGTHQAEAEGNMAWHTANSVGNANFIGIERCQSMGNLAIFKQNEEQGFKLGAQILKRYGLPANRNTIKLHKQFVSTACPHRGSEIHGVLAQAVQDYFIAQTQKYMTGTSTPAPTPSKPAPSNANKNGIAIDNVSKDQATKMVQRIQTKYAWTLLRDQVKAVKQKDGRYTLTIKSGKGNRLNQCVNRLKQELKSYHPGYMQQNIAIVDGDKDSARIEARNMSVDFSDHMRSFLKDILLDGQTYAEKNSYGTHDVRVKGEGFNNTDAPIVLKEIQEMGKAKDVKINPTHIKGFKY